MRNTAELTAIYAAILVRDGHLFISGFISIGRDTSSIATPPLGLSQNLP